MALTRTLLTKPHLPTPLSHLHLLTAAQQYSTSFLVTKTPKHLRRKRPKKPSPRTTPIQPSPSSCLPHLESLLTRDAHFRFLTRSKQFLSKQPENLISLDQAGKLYRELGFPRGRKVTKSASRHPLLFQVYRHTDNKMWLGFTGLMQDLVAEERKIIADTEEHRVNTVKKLLMMSKHKRMPLSKIYHCRSLFGVPEDFRDWVTRFPEDFRVVYGSDGGRVLELVKWDPALAVSALEKEFMSNEDGVRKKLCFPVKHGKALELEDEEGVMKRRLDELNTLPLVSPYSDGWRHEMWTLEAEKYRVGVIHELLSLTIEKRAMIHQIVEFKEEFSLTKHTYMMLKKQPRAFYLAGTEMNWCVFLKDGYDQRGDLVDKDPLVLFYDKLYKYAEMQSGEELGVDEEGHETEDE